MFIFSLLKPLNPLPNNSPFPPPIFSICPIIPPQLSPNFPPNSPQLSPNIPPISPELFLHFPWSSLHFPLNNPIFSPTLPPLLPNFPPGGWPLRSRPGPPLHPPPAGRISQDLPQILPLFGWGTWGGRRPPFGGKCGGKFPPRGKEEGEISVHSFTGSPWNVSGKLGLGFRV